MRSSFLVILVLMLLSVGTAHASTDIKGLFDARSHGMGGTGVAFLDSAGAIPLNPALLDQIGKLTISLDVYYISSQPEAPYTVYHLDPSGRRYENYESIRSPAVGAPLPFVGAAYRLFDRVVIGAAVYPIIGQGASAKYHPAPDQYPDIEATVHAALGLIELGVPVSVRLLDNLSVAAMWRVTYMTQSETLPIPTGVPPAGIAINPATNSTLDVKISNSGFNFGGLQLGVLWKILPNLRFGLTYRSKVVVDGSGTTTTKIGTMASVLPTKSNFSSPHTFRAGLAWSVFDDKLLLATDFSYLLYEDAFKELDTTTIMNGVASTASTPLHWRNSVEAQFGAEYKVADRWRLRVGGIVLNSATNPTYAIAYLAPPGISYFVGGGVGIKIFDSLNMDIAGGYVVLASKVTTATPYNAGVGDYSSHGFEVSESLTYHM